MQLRNYLNMLQRGWWIIALTTLTALTMTLAASYRTVPQYRTSARFIISPNPELSQGGRDLVNTLMSLDKRTVASTFAEVLDSPTIYKETSAELNIPVDRLRSYRVTTVVLPGANILELSATGPDPEVAADLANAIGRRGIDYVTRLYKVYAVEAYDPAMPPAEPVSPQPRRDAGLALVIGLVVGSGLAILREQLRAPLAALRERAAVDPTSMAYNRSYVIARLAELARNGGMPLALGLTQFDGLNDVIGTAPHAVNQGILRRITATFRDNLRGRDVIGRWNETCFVVALPNTSTQSAFETLQGICQGLAQQELLDEEHMALQPRIAVIAYEIDETTDALLERAEAALEKARSSKHVQLAPSLKTASA